ncbi:MAG: NAD(P)-dependent oxidoreductase [Anaerolineae bacterium]|nr:NAD(P)-dependent oxidoreductase [Anaerolineae bacterium]
MRPRNIGILHPGAMGISLAASAKHTGHTVYWTSQGRSQATRDRAASQDLIDAGTLSGLCEVCEVIISICPPAAAETVAADVLGEGFVGLYVDANAISPGRTRRIAQTMAQAGVRFVDGSVIGGPAWEPGRTWLHLAGESAGEAAAVFAAGPLETNILGSEIGRAAALKMAFAAYTKGTSALLSAILAVAEANGVREDLAVQWSRNGAGFAEQTENRVRSATTRAWRYADELDEIAATFSEAGLPPGFGQAAAEIYRRTAHFKDAPEPPDLASVLAALLR